MGLLSSKPTLEEQLRANKREINRSIRELDRERLKLEAEERRLIADIRQTAGKGEMTSTTIMARELVRVRRHQRKFYQMRSQLQAVNLRLQTVKSTQSMADSMKSVAKIMIKMDEQSNIAALQKGMFDFMRESEKLGFTEDIMTEAIDDALGDEGDEEEEEAVIHQILDEIGVDLSRKLLEAPQGITGSVNKTSPIASPILQPVANDGLQLTETEFKTSEPNVADVIELEKTLQQRLKNLKA